MILKIILFGRYNMTCFVEESKGDSGDYKRILMTDAASKYPGYSVINVGEFKDGFVFNEELKIWNFYIKDANGDNQMLFYVEK
jgi:hypothetical protein